MIAIKISSYRSLHWLLLVNHCHLVVSTSIHIDVHIFDSLPFAYCHGNNKNLAFGNLKTRYKSSSRRVQKSVRPVIKKLLILFFSLPKSIITVLEECCKLSFINIIFFTPDVWDRSVLYGGYIQECSKFNVILFIVSV